MSLNKIIMPTNNIKQLKQIKETVNNANRLINETNNILDNTGYFEVDPILANNSLEVIQKIAQLGQGAKYWKIGDKIPIKLTGSIKSINFTNVIVYAFIIGFNHNPTIEGENSIHFQIGKTANNVDICLIGERNTTPNSNTTVNPFCMNTTQSNTGGWKSSYMRNTICPAFFNLLPAEWRAIISPCDKYSDNIGGNTNNSPNTTVTTDTIFLPSGFELYGYVQTGESSKGGNSQQQYEYYKTHSRAKYRYDNPDMTINQYWTRSVNYNISACFTTVMENNSSAPGYAHYSRGFSPCFKVG